MRGRGAPRCLGSHLGEALLSGDRPYQGNEGLRANNLELQEKTELYVIFTDIGLVVQIAELHF